MVYVSFFFSSILLPSIHILYTIIISLKQIIQISSAPDTVKLYTCRSRAQIRCTVSIQYIPNTINDTRSTNPDGYYIVAAFK